MSYTDMDDSNDAGSDNNPVDADAEADLARATLVGANITSINAGAFPGGVVAEAASAATNDAEAERAENTEYAEKDDDGSDIGPLNLDALPQSMDERQQSDGQDARKG